MKKFLLFFALATLIVSCNNDNDVIGPEDIKYDTVLSLPETEIYVQGQSLRSSVSQTTLTKSSYKWPYVNEAEGWETARFSIRADGYIPGYIDQSSTLYYGRAPGKDGNNRGEVYSLYPYGRYNDRDLDYYQKDKKTGSNIGLFRYVLDQEGLKTQFAIKKAPKVVDILQDEITDNKKNLDKLNEWMALEAAEPGYLDKHVLWYVVKEVGMKNGWHVNGVIVDYEVPDKSTLSNTVPSNVEVDIHQQQHTSWNEIKTSIHVRADVESIEINIPIKQENIVEKDDFAIRVFDFDYSEYHITHTIAHDEKGITIKIENIPAELIQTLKDQFGDGLTIEIHSYCTTEDIWDDLKNSKVVKTGKPCTVNGQIHSALYPESEPAAGEPWPYPIYVDK